MQNRTRLLDSAKVFLIEGLRNHSQGRSAFAIIHTVTAIELALKERIWRIRPELILREAEDGTGGSGRTISLTRLPQRLRDFGTPLSATDVELIFRFARWRNEVVHHVASYEERVARAQLPQLLDFFARYLRQELGETIEHWLPRTLYPTADQYLKEWVRVVADARERAKAIGGVLAQACPVCGSSQVLCLGSDSRVFCHLCSAELYRHERCSQCGKETLVQFSSLALDDTVVCDDCIDAAGDQWIQQQIDIARGK